MQISHPARKFILCASHPPILNEVSSVVFEDEGQKKVVFDNLFLERFCVFREHCITNVKYMPFVFYGSTINMISICFMNLDW